jgi:hypothetical protein
MALQPGPGTVVIIVNEGVGVGISNNPFAGAPVRGVLPTDLFAVLDPAGNPYRVPWSTMLDAIGTVPGPVSGEAIVTHTGEALVTHTGEELIL